MNNDFPYRTQLAKTGAIVLGLIALLLIVKIVTGIKAFGVLGQDYEPRRTIAVSAEGEVFAVPDIAYITFTTRGEGATPMEAQNKVTEKMDAAFVLVKASGVEEKDIKTTSYSSTPKYEEREQKICYGYCPPISTGKIISYDVSHTVRLTVRKTDSTGAILQGLADKGLTEISGPEFGIDDEDMLRAQARTQAIDEAKEKATTLAKDLGVRVGRVVSFSEGSNFYPTALREESMDKAMTAGAPAPSLPTGENRISVNVTVVYEIR